MSKRKKYHVTPTGDGNWEVKKQGASRASAISETKAGAIDRGRKLAKGGGLGQLIIHKQDGKFQTEYTYGDDPYPPEG